MSGYVKLASQITELIPIIKCIALEFGEKNGWNSFVQWDIYRMDHLLEQLLSSLPILLKI